MSPQAAVLIRGVESKPPAIGGLTGGVLIDPTKEERQITAMVISPDQARDWMKRFNPRNRPLKKKGVSDYCSAIRDGRYQFNYVPIVFDWDLRLMDGQHRLKACVDTDTSIVSSVVFGLSPALRGTFDAIPRTVTDSLGLNGHLPGKNAVHCQAVAKLLETVRREGMAGLWDTQRHASKQAIVEAITENRFPMLSRAAEVASRAGRVHCRAGVAGFCWYQFAKRDRGTADRFMEQFLTGLHLEDDNSIYHLRNRLTLSKKVEFQELIALFFKAWIYFRDGRPCKRLRWNTEISNPEAFPQI